MTLIEVSDSSDVEESLKAIYYEVVAMMEIFKGQLSFNELMTLDLPLLIDLYSARIKFLEDKRKAEEKELENIRSKK